MLLDEDAGGVAAGAAAAATEGAGLGSGAFYKDTKKDYRGRFRYISYTVSQTAGILYDDILAHADKHMMIYTATYSFVFKLHTRTRTKLADNNSCIRIK